MTALAGNLRPSPFLRLLRGKAEARGTEAGTTAYHGGPRPARPVHVWTFTYDRAHLDERPDEPVHVACGRKDAAGVTWILADGVHDEAIVDEIGEAFGLHRLVREDVASTTQRAKLEAYDGYVYVVLPMITFDPARTAFHAEQVSLVLGDGWVLAFLEDPGDVFEPVRNRLRAGSALRGRGADALFAALVDVIVDGYFVALEAAGDRLAALELRVMGQPDPDVQIAINGLRRELMLFRRGIWPVREVTGQLERLESALVRDETRPYFRDTYDHAVQAIDITESLRELVSGLTDLYLSSLSNRMNEVMKTLTIVSALFIPLTFIAGVYGMNFHGSPYNMPELEWRYGYPAALAFMALTAAIMVGWFWWRGWLGRGDRRRRRRDEAA